MIFNIFKKISTEKPHCKYCANSDIPKPQPRGKCTGCGAKRKKVEEIYCPNCSNEVCDKCKSNRSEVEYINDRRTRIFWCKHCDSVSWIKLGDFKH